MAKETKENFDLPFTKGSKMRIRTFTGEGIPVEDRLVEQATELRVGPKEPHNGPYTIEFNLVNQADVDGMIDYIRKLKGELPILQKEKKSSTTKSLDKMLSQKEPLLDLIKTMKTKCKTQEDLMAALREYNFMFLDWQSVEDLGVAKQREEGMDPMIQLKQRHIDENWQFMVRRSKEAVNPMNDKFDFRLLFGIKIIGEKVGKVQVYLEGTWLEVWKLEWKDAKKVNFKKVEKVYSFPEWMDYADRKKWRIENRKLERASAKGETVEPSKFYLKAKPYIKINGEPPAA